MLIFESFITLKTFEIAYRIPCKWNALRFRTPPIGWRKEVVLSRDGYGVASAVKVARITSGAVQDGVSYAAGHGCQCNIVVDELSPLHQHQCVPGMGEQPLKSLVAIPVYTPHGRSSR